MAADDCPFCARLKQGPLVASNALAAAFGDKFPVTDGHCLIVPRRHVADFFELAREEQSAIWQLLPSVRDSLAAAADGFNVGVNVGASAGQTVPHAHVHVIPRRHGDVPDPRGGVRWVVPAKAAYWAK
jgi:diadenosine tetraphosphate (Ap4A) HIT family hydrolase